MAAEPLHRIPGLDHQDAAVVQSLLESAGFYCRAHEGFGRRPPALFVREGDLPAVKQFLSDYRIRTARDEQIAIPW
jgi:hypothetical protein